MFLNLFLEILEPKTLNDPKAQWVDEGCGWEMVLLYEKWWPVCIWMVYDVWTAANSPFLHVLTLIYCNRVPHCPWCAVFTVGHWNSVSDLFPSFISFIPFTQGLFVCWLKMLRHNVKVKMMWIQMWLLRHLEWQHFLLCLFIPILFPSWLCSSSSFWLFLFFFHVTLC